MKLRVGDVLLVFVCSRGACIAGGGVHGGSMYGWEACMTEGCVWGIAAAQVLRSPHMVGKRAVSILLKCWLVERSNHWKKNMYRTKICCQQVFIPQIASIYLQYLHVNV